MNLLYVEDDPLLAKTLKSLLSNWFNVDIAGTCEKGLKKADETEYDIIVIDYYLPDSLGIELCKQLRSSNTESLILFLTENNSKQIVIEALDSGADDYLTKPFNYEELRARLHSLARRRYNQNSSIVLKCGQFFLDQQKHEVYYRKTPIYLKRKEFHLFEYFMMNRGQVITRSRLYENVWNRHYYSSNTVDVHIRRLRSKIELPFKEKILLTVYGVGYKLVC